MPKFAANLTMLYNEVDFLDRFDAAARDGFKGVEYLFPYPYEKQQLVDRLKKNDLTQVLHNLPAGDWAAGERGIAILPDRVGEFQDSVGKAIEYATALGCKKVNVLAGIAPKKADADKLRETFISNLKFAAPKLKDAGIMLVMEPINTYDMPGFYLNHTQQALDLIDAVGSDNLFVQYDIYHMQRMEGELAATIQKHFAKIGHIQIADNPGRNEPGTGEINYPFLFKFIDQLGYDGWVSGEYKPAGKTSDGLGWMRT
ncbi:MAG: 2-oxo-tetronate isomerase [Burkholderiaceae bacterium]